MQRTRIVLLAGQGIANAEIARRIGSSRQTVIDWRERYRVEGIAGLEDLARSGRPRVIDDAAVVVETLQPPPAKLVSRTGRPGCWPITSGGGVALSVRGAL